MVDWLGISLGASPWVLTGTKNVWFVIGDPNGLGCPGVGPGVVPGVGPGVSGVGVLRVSGDGRLPSPLGSWLGVSLGASPPKV
jgi:hypothetical protein